MKASASKIPSPKGSLQEALRDVDEHGVGIVERVLSPEKTKEVREAIRRSAELAEKHGVKTRGVVPADADTNNIRVLELFNWDPIFVELATHPVALGAVRHLLGERFIISNYTANITGPGAGSMLLHADQGYVTPPWPDTPLAVNTLWMIDDFTEEVGATRIVPGSNRSKHSPDPKQKYETVPVEAPAGSMLIMDGRVWHTSGHNRTKDRYRAGILGYYTVPWIRQQRNWNLRLRPEVVQTMSQEFLQLLGYTEGNTELFRRGWNV